MSEEAKGLAGEILEAAQVVVDAPHLLGYFRYQADNEEARARWIAVAKELAIVFGLGILADWLAWFLLRVPERRLRARAGKEATQQLMFLAAGAVIEALPILVFAAVAFIVLPLTAAEFRHRPSRPDADRRLSVVANHRHGGARAAAVPERLGAVSARRGDAPLPVHLGAALHQLDGLRPGRRRLRVVAQRAGRDLCRAAAHRGAGAGRARRRFRVAEPQAGGGLAARRSGGRTPRSPGWKLFRYRLAEIWHILALIYILGTFGVFSLHIEGGILFLLRSTVVSVVLVLAAALAVQFIHRAVRRGFAISPELKARFPTLETRTNRYIPALTLVVSVAVYVLAAIALLQAWGVDAFTWLQATASSRAAGSLASVAVALLAALVAWEVFISLLERHMQQLENDSRKRARAETFFPFLRLVVVVILGVVLGFVVLDALGISLGPLLAGAGVFGLVAGLGSQAIIKDIMTSIAVLVDDTIAVGDYIDVGNGREGTVEAIKLRTIKLLTQQGGIMTVPFSEAHVITNLSKDASFYVANISVSYFEDCNRAIALLKETAEAMREEPAYKRVILAPLEIFGLDRFEPGAYIIQARLKTQRAKHLATGRDFNRRVKEAFDHHHIAMRSDLLAPVSPAG